MFVKPYLFGALTLLSASSALALTCANDYGSSAGCASNTTAAGDCATLGYSKDNVDGCEHYLYCPFDTSYKRCVSSEEIDCAELGFTQEDKSEWCNSIVTCQTDASYTLCAATENCDGFPLSGCPEGAISCSSCGIGTNVSYKVDSCKEGYELSGNTCVEAYCNPSDYPLSSCEWPMSCGSCKTGDKWVYYFDGCYSGVPNADKTACICDDGYNLTDCPSEANCDKCEAESPAKYKIIGCKSGYILRNGTCRAKTCSDYGYSTYANPGRVCKTRYSFKTGDSTSYCYGGCKTCSSTEFAGRYHMSLAEACLDYGRGACLQVRNTPVYQYSYGTCTIYTRVSYSSERDCTHYGYRWCR